jgi:hypothetical protein
VEHVRAVAEDHVGAVIDEEARALPLPAVGPLDEVVAPVDRHDHHVGLCSRTLDRPRPRARRRPSAR